MQSAKKSYEHYSHDSLLSLIQSDFLQCALRYTGNENAFELSLSNGTSISLLADGIIAFNDNSNVSTCKSIVVSCGVHGNETAPIEICNQLVNDLLNQKITTPHRVLFIFGNLASMASAERFIEENLNRLFSAEQSSSSLEGKRASSIMAIVDNFFNASDESSQRIHYDLHTAIRPSKNEKFAVYPFLHGKPYSKQQLAFLSACEVNTILLSRTPTTTFSYYSSLHHQAHAFTVELGTVMPFGQNDMSKFTAVTAKLIELLTKLTVDVPHFSQCNMEIYVVNQVINKQHDDFCLHFDDNIANFATFSKGDIIASETNCEYRAQHDGEAIVFPNANVAIGQRALLTVIPYEL
ncbi:MAG: succinylglutamate desuccinylase [Kangiellaceae bacterium]|jgi:succinylglutamate desuccinylase